jgi:hypothetical protein
VPAGRVLYAHLHLLDRQLVDPNDRLVGKVDDLEIALDDGGRPYITAILCGPLALGPRLGGRLGRWITSIAARLQPGADPAPHRIDLGVVTDIGSSVRVSRRRSELDVEPLEHWVDTHVISRIPGSGHASE